MSDWLKALCVITFGTILACGGIIAGVELKPDTPEPSGRCETRFIVGSAPYPDT